MVHNVENPKSTAWESIGYGCDQFHGPSAADRSLITSLTSTSRPMFASLPPLGDGTWRSMLKLMGLDPTRKKVGLEMTGALGMIRVIRGMHALRVKIDCIVLQFTSRRIENDNMCVIDDKSP